MIIKVCWFKKNELEALNKSTAQMDQKLAENEKQLQNAKDELAKIEASHERGQQKVYQIQQKVSALENDCQTLRTAAQEKQRELKTLQLAIKNSSQTGESSDSSELADRQKNN